MPLDGLTLGFIARELNETLSGGRIDKIMQPFKDMLLLNIRASGKNHRLLIAAGPTYTRIHLTEQSYENPKEAPMFLMLMRKHLMGGRILSIRQISGDRLLCIRISALSEMGDEQEKNLYFEAMGRHTNLTLEINGLIIDSIRHVTNDMSRVRLMLPGLPFEMPPAQDKLDPSLATAETLYQLLSQTAGRFDKALCNHLSGFSAASAREVAYRLTRQEDGLLPNPDRLPELCNKLTLLLAELPTMACPLLVRNEEGLPTDALPFAFETLQGFSQVKTDTLSAAVDTLYFEQDRHDRIMQKSSALRRTLKNAESRCENRIAAQQEEIANAAYMEDFRIAGELLTAFSHMVAKGADKADLPNYYDENKPLTIELDPALSPSANAQRYFKKYRKAAVAKRVAAQQLIEAQNELSIISDALYFIDQSENEEDLRNIRLPLYESGIIKKPPEGRSKKQPESGKPLVFTTSDGFKVSVGKNSAQNESLLKDAEGSDLWFHVKDMPGSHVIVHLRGQKAPDSTIHEAAMIAVYYSKAQGMPAEVDYTLRKFVKKVSGAPRGHVIFSGQTTMRTQATKELIDRLSTPVTAGKDV